MGKITKDINLFQFQELLTSGYNLSHLYILEMIDDGKIIKGIYGHEPYLNDLYNLGSVDTEFEITLEGKNLLKEVYSKVQKKVAKKVKKEYDERFLEWFRAYPAKDLLDDFAGVRNLRVNKDQCHDKYLQLLKTYFHEDMLKALEFEKMARIDQSYIRKENQLTFMRSTLPYLNNFEDEGAQYIELAKKGPYRNKRQQTNTVKHNKIAF